MALQKRFRKIHKRVKKTCYRISRMTVPDEQREARQAIVDVLTECQAGLEGICDNPTDPQRSLSLPPPQGSQS